MINEINIKGWDNKIVNHPKVVYPQCNDSGARVITLFHYLLALVAVEKRTFLQNY